MGYYTCYSMEVRKIKDRKEFNDLLEALKAREILATENQYGTFSGANFYDEDHIALFASYDECKWYDHTYDMVVISKLFPNMVFRLSGEGEARYDMWHEYFHNGEAEECRAQIIFPKPSTIEWEE